jgi:hypothetical protein
VNLQVQGEEKLISGYKKGAMLALGTESKESLFSL